MNVQEINNKRPHSGDNEPDFKKVKGSEENDFDALYRHIFQFAYSTNPLHLGDAHYTNRLLLVSKGFNKVMTWHQPFRVVMQLLLGKDIDIDTDTQISLVNTPLPPPVCLDEWLKKTGGTLDNLLKSKWVKKASDANDIFIKIAQTLMGGHYQLPYDISLLQNRVFLPLEYSIFKSVYYCLLLKKSSLTGQHIPFSSREKIIRVLAEHFTNQPHTCMENKALIHPDDQDRIIFSKVLNGKFFIREAYDGTHCRIIQENHELIDKLNKMSREEIVKFLGNIFITIKNQLDKKSNENRGNHNPISILYSFEDEAVRKAFPDEIILLKILLTGIDFFENKKEFQIETKKDTSLEYDQQMLTSLNLTNYVDIGISSKKIDIKCAIFIIKMKNYNLFALMNEESFSNTAVIGKMLSNFDNKMASLISDNIMTLILKDDNCCKILLKNRIVYKNSAFIDRINKCLSTEIKAYKQYFCHLLNIDSESLQFKRELILKCRKFPEISFLFPDDLLKICLEDEEFFLNLAPKIEKEFPKSEFEKRVFEFLPEKIKSSKLFFFTNMKTGGPLLFRFASESILDNKVFGFQIMSINPDAYDCLSNRLRGDEEIFMKYFDNRPVGFKFIPWPERSNRALMLKLVSVHGNMFPHIPEDFRKEFEFIVIAVQKDPNNMKSMTNTLRQHSRFMRQIFTAIPGNCEHLLSFLPRDVRNNPLVIAAAKKTRL